MKKIYLLIIAFVSAIFTSCASASSIVITTINAIMSFDSNSITYEKKKDALIIYILKKNKNTKLLLDNMINLLNELSSQYNDNIKVIGG